MDDIAISRPGQGIVVIELLGDHDCTTETEVGALLAGHVSNNDIVVLDVSNALFIDSSLLHNLVLADRAASARDSRFVVQVGTAHIGRLLEISGLLHDLTVVHDRDDATRVCPAQARASSRSAGCGEHAAAGAETRQRHLRMV